ncbi:VC0807 family protein [Kitasatospora sp. LaBMicrA B282]|uniref:VC0807 family protein n=1 Tax=Kitasatospora sp. LaBMicrA B282 TaxID=3420949 RepID=UPI003D0F3865
MSEITSIEAVGGTGKPRNPLVGALLPLVVDVAVPLATYYAAHSLLGLGMVDSLIVSSVVPAVRTLYGLLRERSVNGLAGLMLVVNVVGIVATCIVGDPRLMIAKDGLVSSAVGAGILVSALRGKPLMALGLRPFLTGGKPAREAAWDRLTTDTESAEGRLFRTLALRHSVVWGLALLVECLARVVGAYTLPLHTMVWLPTVFLVGAIGAASMITAPTTDGLKKLLGEQA